MDTIRTPESQAAAMKLKVVLTMATELTARYRISMEASTSHGVQDFGNTTLMELMR
jgi:hypothetical protein